MKPGQRAQDYYWAHSIEVGKKKVSFIHVDSRFL